MLALFFAFVALTSSFLMHINSIDFLFWTVLVLLVGAICLFLTRALWRGMRYLKDRLVPKLRLMQDDIATSLQADFENIPVLTLRAKGDEAAGYLRFVDIVARIPFEIWSPTILLRTVLSSIVLAIVFSGAVAFIRVSEKQEDALEMVWTLILAYSVLLGVAVVVLLMIATIATIACMLWPKIFRGHALGFGERGIMQNYLVKIFASSRPVNAERFHDELFQFKGRGLHHSKLYQDQLCLHSITTWLSTWGERMPNRGMQSTQ
jgi:hypothetical protein